MASEGDLIAGRYEVRGVLGEGGTGIVYDAVRKDDGRAVALKVMHAELAGDGQVRGRFQREAAILRRLEGPHICPILDHGEVPGTKTGRNLVYLAMAKLEGPSLEKVLETEGPLSIDRALDIVLEVLAALRVAHAQGVIHRDLKPANVILEGGERVVVVDFGMAKIVTGAGTGTTNLTANNMLFGTPEYMSPEQARGDELDARCDVYAVGVMLYEMLAGRKPFVGHSPLAVLTAHLTSELDKPSAHAPDRVTPALESVVLHALARDRDARYPTAAALAAALTHARAVPEDVDSLRPEAFGPSPEGTDAFAATMPAIAAPKVSVSPPEAAPAPSDALAKTIEGTPRPSRISSPSSRVTPPASGRPSGAPTSGDEARRRRALEASEAAEKRKWLAVWILVACVSIGVGVFLALR